MTQHQHQPRRPQQPSDDTVADFLDECGWADSNVANAISSLNRWTRFLTERGVTVAEASRKDCVAYVRQREGEVKASTARVDWRMLRALYGWLAVPVRDGGGGGRADDPMVGVKGPKVPKRPTTRAAKADEVAKLEAVFDLSELGKRNAAMVSLMWRSGVRVGELPQLDLEDYQQLGNDRALLAIDETKTDEPRVVPVHYETQRYLARYLRKRGTAPGPLFRGNPERTRSPEGRLATKAIQEVVRRARPRAGVRVSPHQLRRGFTSKFLIDSGGDVLTLEIVGGWADHRMPRRYLADEEAQASVQRFYDVADSEPVTSRRRPGRLRSV
jgi:site-specific recombinase XerD